MDTKKEKQSIALIKAAYEESKVRGGRLELAYSGGKDSEVMRVLAGLANVPVRLLYKDTTIDRPYTHKYVLERGAEIIRPKVPLLKTMEKKALPNMFRRWCCSIYKEYVIEPTQLIGIRRAESQKRAKRYTEPQMCRVFKGKKTSSWFPILTWEQSDVLEFVKYHNVELHPLYYNDWGEIDVKRRLGCIGCPLQGDRGKADFKEYPKMLRAWYRADKAYIEKHPRYQMFCKTAANDLFYHLFCVSKEQFYERVSGAWPIEPLSFLEDYFRIKLE